MLSDGIISKESRAVFSAGNPSTASDSPETRQICFETDLGASAYIKQVKLSPDIYMNYGSRFPVGFVLEASENADFSKPVTLAQSSGQPTGTTRIRGTRKAGPEGESRSDRNSGVRCFRQGKILQNIKNN